MAIDVFDTVGVIRREEAIDVDFEEMEPAWVTEIMFVNGILLTVYGRRTAIADQIRAADWLDVEAFSTTGANDRAVYTIRTSEVYMIGSERQVFPSHPQISREMMN